MTWVISNPGPLGIVDNPGFRQIPKPPITCPHCKKEDGITISDVKINDKIIVYCSNCKTEFNVDRLKHG